MKIFSILAAALCLFGCERNNFVTKSGVKVEVIQEGNGATPNQGQIVTVHYTGWLTDSTKFDSSVDRGQPFTYQFGVGQVIQGWDDGVATLKVGGKSRFTIPPELGYGRQGAGGIIPPNATLIFEVELLGIQ
ncbi:MAG: FKBP-type peptidyl-prolyl cis-trans isomerase [Ignavibacteriales bacterium]|nr:FKBP-type peptidyl-prolyl cis-trans isomerase [Ignavibacteriales bacterium]